MSTIAIGLICGGGVLAALIAVLGIAIHRRYRLSLTFEPKNQPAQPAAEAASAATPLARKAS